jgi:hypothetical protein
MLSSAFFHGRELDNFVLVYTMGKVGSTAIAQSLNAVGIFARHLQWVTPETQAFFDRMESIVTGSELEVIFNLQSRLNARRAYQALRNREYASLIKVITVIRAPIEQILSHYFHGIAIIERVFKERGQTLDAASLRDDILQSIEFYLTRSDWKIAELTNGISAENYERIWFCWLVHNYVHWFDDEFRPFFPADILGGNLLRGHQVVDNALILRLEDFATAAEPIIAAYVQRPQFKLLRENVGADKDYGKLYREVADTTRLPKEFVNHLCDCKYVRHFYGDEERRLMRQKWTN